jgi:hypothetical protein
VEATVQHGWDFCGQRASGHGQDDSVRDVVAAIIVGRAKVLAAHGSKLAGAQDKIDIGNSDVTYYTLDSALSSF